MPLSSRSRCADAQRLPSPDPRRLTVPCRHIPVPHRIDPQPRVACALLKHHPQHKGIFSRRRADKSLHAAKILQVRRAACWLGMHSETPQRSTSYGKGKRNITTQSSLSLLICLGSAHPDPLFQVLDCYAGRDHKALRIAAPPKDNQLRKYCTRPSASMRTILLDRLRHDE
jgi:hypothetical protein